MPEWMMNVDWELERLTDNDLAILLIDLDWVMLGSDYPAWVQSLYDLLNQEKNNRKEKIYDP